METDTIFCALISLLLTTTFCVIFSNNTIYSALFLILSFMIGALLLFVIGSDFYALSIIIIYVGAVAVLVLFIIMMINTKSLLPYDFNEHINRNFYLWVIFVHFSTAHVVTYFKSWF
jgi:NADH:ubiquinone oxidoreductase subunit 6 (subunit J)